MGTWQIVLSVYGLGGVFVVAWYLADVWRDADTLRDVIVRRNKNESNLGRVLLFFSLWPLATLFWVTDWIAPSIQKACAGVRARVDAKLEVRLAVLEERKKGADEKSQTPA